MKVLVVVLILGDSKDIYEAVAKEMAPFDCENEAEPYKAYCECVGRRAQNAAERYARKVAGTYQEINQRFDEEYGESDARRGVLFELAEERSLSKAQELELEHLAELFHERWTEAHEPYKRAQFDALEQHPLKDQPDPECKICGGSGAVISDFNPNTQFDYWSIGWHDFFRLSPEPEVEHQKGLVQRLTNRKKKRKETRDPDGFKTNVIAVRDIPADGRLSAARLQECRRWQMARK